jgi:hypothetical protein
MPIGNIVRSRIKDQVRKSMGQYSSTVLNTIGGPLDQITSKINATEAQVLQKIPGALQELGKVVYEVTKQGHGLGRTAAAIVLQLLGNVEDGTEVIPEEYKIKIESSNLKVVVVAIMQDKTTFGVTSDWEPFLPLGAVSQAANTVTTGLTGRALLSRFMTRRIWKGTSPVSITMNLMFQSVTDTYTNVIAPCKALMQMALPSDTGTVFGTVNIPLVAPPGPSPFVTADADSEQQQSGTPAEGNTADQKKTNAVKDFISAMRGGGDQITVRIGNYLVFKSVIVREVRPVLDTKLSVDGWPISAEVAVTFESYEIMTKQTLDQAFKQRV